LLPVADVVACSYSRATAPVVVADRVADFIYNWEVGGSEGVVGSAPV